MSKRLISSGSTFETLAGYSRAVVENGLVHVSGTTGFDYAAMRISDDLLEQTHQTFRNIAAALEQAGASLDDVVRVHYLITDASYFEPIAPLLGKYFARARPAATMMVVGLIDPRMKIEIEVTARIPG
ncbi:hypothetical protein BH11PSE11_BH11PSE11_19600 [soil metagenome]